MDHLDTNRLILNWLENWISKNPEMRFGQILENSGITRNIMYPQMSSEHWECEFYTPSIETLRRMRRTP